MKVEVVVELSYDEVVTALTNAAKDAGKMTVSGSTLEWKMGPGDERVTEVQRPVGVLVRFKKTEHAGG